VNSNVSSTDTPMSSDIQRWSDELARDPASLAFLELGEALRRDGQIDVALTIVRRGLDRHPDNVDAHNLMARVAIDKRDFVRAAEEWQTVLRLSPDHVGALKGLGYICYQEGRLEDAERYLKHAATRGGDPSVATALESVRRSSGQLSTATVEALAPADPRSLFADLLVDAEQTALLLDESGLVLGGIYLDGDGTDLAHEIGAQLSGISDEAVRTTRHLGIGDWKSIVFETEIAAVAMASTSNKGLLVVAASRATPLGLLRRVLDQCATRAKRWLDDEVTR
jgi:tetratricopeptide (TPR) repeat protein